MMPKIYILFFWGLSFLSVSLLAAPKGLKKLPEQPPLAIKKIFNETYEFDIRWSFFHVGDVSMQTKLQTNSPFVKIYAKVIPLRTLRYFYHIEGTFGSLWNFVTRKPYEAFEDIYQGKKHQKRYFKFNQEGVYCKIDEKKFSSYGFPHNGRSWVTRATEETQNIKGYQDLLGSFYYIRTLQKKPKEGDVFEIKVLPAGSRKVLILRIIKIYTSDEVPFFGTKKIMHVKSALRNINSNKTEKGGDLFLNTKSQINMWITYDEYYVPVKLWASVEYLGELKILLSKYEQL